MSGCHIAYRQLDNRDRSTPIGRSHNFASAQDHPQTLITARFEARLMGLDEQHEAQQHIGSINDPFFENLVGGNDLKVIRALVLGYIYDLYQRRSMNSHSSSDFETSLNAEEAGKLSSSEPDVSTSSPSLAPSLELVNS